MRGGLCPLVGLMFFFIALVLGRWRWLAWRLLFPGRNPWRNGPLGGGWGWGWGLGWGWRPGWGWGHPRPRRGLFRGRW